MHSYMLKEEEQEDVILLWIDMLYFVVLVLALTNAVCLGKEGEGGGGREGAA